MTMNETAKVLNCSTKNIYRLITGGVLEPSLIKGDGVTKGSIRVYLKKRYPLLDFNF